jgi:hypothetical protein
MIRIQLPQAEADRLQGLFHSTQDRKLRDRLQIVLMAHRGRPRQDIASDLGIHRIGVTRRLNAYCERGRQPSGRGARPPGARPLGVGPREILVEQVGVGGRGRPMAEAPFELRYQLSSRQRLIPHLHIGCAFAPFVVAL